MPTPTPLRTVLSTALLAACLAHPAAAQRAGTRPAPAADASRQHLPPRPPRVPKILGARQEPVKNGADADAAAVYRPHTRTQPASVVLSSGELRLDRVDLEIPGRGAVHFRMARRYRSRLDYGGPLGHGWTFAYGEALFPVPGGDRIRLDPGGHVDRWTRNPDGSFSAPRGYFGTLKANADGSFTLREPDGFKRDFDAAGKLVAHRDRHGNTMYFVYDAEGRLSSAVDVFGRSVSFVHGPAGGSVRLLRVRDFTGREVVYGYDGNGDLVSARSPIVVGTSTGNDIPEGRTERYAYAGGADPELAHDLVAVTFPNEVASGGPPVQTCAYASDPGDPLRFGRLVAMTLGLPAAPTPSGGTIAFDYTAEDGGEPSGDPAQVRLVVRVDERDGDQIDVRVNERGHLLSERVLTRGFHSGEPAWHETTFEHDTDGQRTRTVLPRGNGSRYAYGSGARAAEGNVVEVRCVEDAATGSGAELVTTFAHDPVYGVVVAVTDPRGNDPDFVPPLGTASAERYTTTSDLDYQEGTGPIPDALEFGIDLGDFPRGLGDRNGDGRTDQVAGDPVRVDFPTVELLDDSRLAAELGGTAQPIVHEWQWNDAGQLTARIDGEGNVTLFTYYPEDDPAGVSGGGAGAPTGYLATVVVDAADSPRRTSAEPPLALATVRVLDEVGQVVGVVDPRGVRTDYEVTALGEVVVVVAGADVSAAIASGQLFPEPPFLFRTERDTDSNGNVVAVRQENRASSSATPGVGDFADVVLAYDPLNQLVSRSQEVDATTFAVTAYEHDQDEFLVAVVLPEGERRVVERDERDLPFRLTLGAGTTVAATQALDFDPNGNLALHTDGADSDGDGSPEARAFEWDFADRPTARIDPSGTRTEVTLDPAGNAVRVTVHGHPPGDPDGEPTVLYRDVHIDVDEANQAFRTFEARFLPTGTVTVRAVSLPDGDGDGEVEERDERDANGRLVFHIDDGGDTWSVRRDGAGRAVETTDPLGFHREVEHDRNGLVVRVEDFHGVDGSPPSSVTLVVHDQLGNPVRTSTNGGRTRRMRFDSLGQMTQSSDAQSFEIPDIFGQWPLVNAEGNTTWCLYDGLGQLTAVIRDLRVGGEGGAPLDTSNPFNLDGRITSTYAWDRDRNLVSFTDDNGNTTTNVLDERGRIASRVLADGSTFAFTFNADGELVQVAQPNGPVVTRELDASGRVVAEHVPSAPSGGTTRKEWEYDALGNPVVARDIGATTRTWSAAYDSLGNRVEEGFGGLGALTRLVEGDGDVTGLTYPGGLPLATPRDALGRQQSVTAGSSPVITSVENLGATNLVTAAGYGNGTTLVQEFDEHLDPVGQRWHLPPSAGGETFTDRCFFYDREHHVITWTDHRRGGEGTFFGLDSVYRVEHANLNSAWNFSTRHFGLDGVDNRRQMDETPLGGPTTTTTHTVSPLNAYVDMGLHDANGNLVDSGAREYVYDAWGRLREVRDATGTAIASYGYWADGRIAEALDFSGSGGPAHERYAYDGDDVIEAWEGAAATPLGTVVHGPTGPARVAYVHPSTPPPFDQYYVHSDPSGSTIALTHGRASAASFTGTWVAQEFAYDESGFTQLVFTFGPPIPVQPFLFLGQRLFEETNLYAVDNTGTSYWPFLARTLQRDVGQPGLPGTPFENGNGYMDLSYSEHFKPNRDGTVSAAFSGPVLFTAPDVPDFASPGDAIRRCYGVPPRGDRFVGFQTEPIPEITYDEDSEEDAPPTSRRLFDNLYPAHRERIEAALLGSALAGF